MSWAPGKYVAGTMAPAGAALDRPALTHFLQWGETVHLVCWPIFGLLYQPWMIDDDECGVVGGTRIGWGTKVLRENLPQCHLVLGSQ
jgi:hypothetical protein